MVRSKIKNIKGFKIKILDRETRIFEMNKAMYMIILKILLKLKLRKQKLLTTNKLLK